MSAIAVVLACLLTSVIWNILFWDRSFGISMPIFVTIVISFLLWFKRANISKTKLTLSLHILFMAYLSICVVSYRNSLILYAAVPTIFLGLAAFAFVGRDGYSFSNSLGVVESLFKTAFGGVIAAPSAIGLAFNQLTGTDKTSRATTKVFLGILISVPFLILFTSLFTSADPIFEKQIRNFLDLIWQPDIFKRAFVVILMWYLFSGYLARSEKFTSLQSHLDRTQPRQNFDGIIVFVFLLMINLLFLSFIIIQLGYLFGGEEIIRNTFFTYAGYAHKGFYELWAAVIFVSIIILFTDYKFPQQKGCIRRFVVCAWIAMIFQTFVIIASAFKRIVVYEEAYGYTYLRILVALFLLWMAGVFMLFIVKIIRTKSISWLISSGLCLAFMFLLFVSTFSIDKFIARKNIDRHLNQGQRLDTEYLASLSTDAFSEIQRLKTQTDNELFRESAENILQQMRQSATENLQHWPSWNLSQTKAAKP